MSDLRLRDLIVNKIDGKNISAEIILFPSDEGVKRNGGRTGAAEAPQLILNRLLNLTPDPRLPKTHRSFLKKVAIRDGITCTGDVERDQENLGEVVSDCMGRGAVPIILGGGHETSFGHFLGYTKAGKEVSILNIDAHTDVRPLKEGKAHSGSPFFQAISHPSNLCKSYCVAGLNPSSVSEDHYKYVQKIGECLFENETSAPEVNRILQNISGNRAMVTMDMDVVSQADAPGVSAPNASGITKSLWLELALQFGKNRSVSSFDICEVNPSYDRDNQTVNLAALTVWHFILGLALRK